MCLEKKKLWNSSFSDWVDFDVSSEIDLVTKMIEDWMNNNLDYYLKKFPELKLIRINKELGKEKMGWVVEVHMAEKATTISEKKNHILATSWAWSCTIVWWYSKWKSFLMHLNWMNKINSKYNDSFKEIAEQNKRELNNSLFFVWNNENEKFKIIVSWWFLGDEQLEEIIEWIIKMTSYNIKNKYEILITNSSSLAIDSKTWEFFKYNPMKNSNKEELNSFSAMNSNISSTHYEFKN